MKYHIRLISLLVFICTCTSEKSEIVVEVEITSDKIYYDVRSDQVLVQGSVSAANLFSVQGSKVEIKDIPITNYGHAIFSSSISNPDEVLLSSALDFTENPENSSADFLSEFPGLNAQTTYFTRTYAQYEDQNAPVFSEEEPFSISSIRRVNFWDPNPILFEGDTRTAPVSFGIGNQAFIGTGFRNTQFGENLNLKDLWKYNTNTNSWNLINGVSADFEGRSNAVVVTIGNSAYLGMGIQTLGTSTSPQSYNSLNDFWKYTPASNTWEELASFPGDASGGQFAVAIGDKAYIGMGTVVSNEGAFSLSGEFYEYNSSSDEWTKKADFPGELRSGAIAFGIGTKVYYGLGSSRIDGPFIGDGFNYLNDLYEYDIESNTWRQLNDLPIQFRRAEASSFAVNGKGYVVAGRRSLLNVETFDDFLTYDPQTDSWTQLEDIPGGARYNNNIAVLNDRVMLGLGSTSNFGSADANKELYFYYYIPSN